MMARKKKVKVEEPVVEELSFAPEDVYNRDGLVGLMALVAVEVNLLLADVQAIRVTFGAFLNGPAKEK